VACIFFLLHHAYAACAAEQHVACSICAAWTVASESHYYLWPHAVKNVSWRQVLFKWHARLPQQQQQQQQQQQHRNSSNNDKPYGHTKAFGAQFDVKRVETEGELGYGEAQYK